MNASLKLELPGIITNLMLCSTSETLADGTKTFTLKGKNVSVKTRKLIAGLANLQRDTKTTTVYSGTGDDYDWSVTFGRGIEFLTIKVFVLNDYTAPQAADEAAKSPSTTKATFDAMDAIIGAPADGLRMTRSDERDGYAVYYITWGNDRGRISVPVDTKKGFEHASFYCDGNITVLNLQDVMKAQAYAIAIIQTWEKQWGIRA